MALPKAPPKKLGIAALLMAIIFSSPFLIQAFSASYHPGVHTQSGLYRFLPVEWTLSSSVPVFHPAYRHVKFAGSDGHYYFLDRNSSGKEGNGFWVYGDASAELLVEAPYKVSRFTFQACWAPTPIDGEIQRYGGSARFHLSPEVAELIEFPSGNGRRLINIYGQERWVYWLKFKLVGGSIPKFTNNSGDERYLGAFFTPMETKADIMYTGD